MRIPSTRRPVTIPILVAFLSGACSTVFMGCPRADDLVKIFSFDVDNQRVYHGKKEDPSDEISFHDVKIEGLIAMPLSDWTAVRDRLATCH